MYISLLLVRLKAPNNLARPQMMFAPCFEARWFAATVVELGFRVMDSTLTLAAWQDFARNFERELSVNSGQ